MHNRRWPKLHNSIADLFLIKKVDYNGFAPTTIGVIGCHIELRYFERSLRILILRFYGKEDLRGYPIEFPLS